MNEPSTPTTATDAVRFELLLSLEVLADTELSEINPHKASALFADAVNDLDLVWENVDSLSEVFTESELPLARELSRRAMGLDWESYDRCPPQLREIARQLVVRMHRTPSLPDGATAICYPVRSAESEDADHFEGDALASGFISFIDAQGRAVAVQNGQLHLVT